MVEATTNLWANISNPSQLSLVQKRTQKSPTGDTIITPDMEISLQDLPSRSQQPEDFSHPFYWAPFTMIGNPW
ncbi:MAG: hypothetical protein IGQ45_00685 [Cyanobacterium sp. T60_A2020_053]|nr:hypothetical protein [Cyanobacterium sp. T60_A2020_053]